MRTIRVTVWNGRDRHTQIINADKVIRAFLREGKLIICVSGCGELNLGGMRLDELQAKMRAA